MRPINSSGTYDASVGAICWHPDLLLARLKRGSHAVWNVVKLAPVTASLGTGLPPPGLLSSVLIFIASLILPSSISRDIGRAKTCLGPRPAFALFPLSTIHPSFSLTSALARPLLLFLSSDSPSHSVRSRVGSTKPGHWLHDPLALRRRVAITRQSQAHQQLWHRAKWPLVFSRVTTLPGLSFWHPPPKRQTWEISSFRDYSSSYSKNCKTLAWEWDLKAFR
ncbi:uncharacterized protein TrAtP1_008670 [Trichoderma atroviride]|uniref:uncharacterized protein n=1 Tax=Hypocrea atroviridis TaxID=63577 RepID=UPI00331D56F5|nr:hypothetical protein TrAtP1_008670 [Trichoderma atroviride]